MKPCVWQWTCWLGTVFCNHCDGPIRCTEPRKCKLRQIEPEDAA